jgi:hypothetical protein
MLNLLVLVAVAHFDPAAIQQVIVALLLLRLKS